MEPTEIGPSSSQPFPVDVSQGEEEEEEEQEEGIIILRTKSPLPIQVMRPLGEILETSPTHSEQGKTSFLWQLPENLQRSGLREIMWTPGSNTIPTQEEWDPWIESRIQDAFQGSLTPLE